jgi:hypothetical protein
MWAAWTSPKGVEHCLQTKCSNACVLLCTPELGSNLAHCFVLITSNHPAPCHRPTNVGGGGTVACLGLLFLSDEAQNWHPKNPENFQVGWARVRNNLNALFHSPPPRNKLMSQAVKAHPSWWAHPMLECQCSGCFEPELLEKYICLWRRMCL